MFNETFSILFGNFLDEVPQDPPPSKLNKKSSILGHQIFLYKTPSKGGP